MNIGVLAIQGDFEAHLRAVTRLGAVAVEVRRPADIRGVDGLIIPGGESTTMLKVALEESIWDELVEFGRSGRAIFGTCAGAILLAREVLDPSQRSLGLIDISIRRNGYGRQLQSFIGRAECELEGGPLETVFIRAPVINRTGPGVKVLARQDDIPVLVCEGKTLAATFHPELTSDDRVHRLFLEHVAG